MARKKIEKKGKVLAQKTPSYKSLLYGALTVAVLFVVLLFGLNFMSNRQSGDIGEDAINTESIPTDSKTAAKAGSYEVKEGETLWSIAVAKYDDGYMWTEIAKANKLSNPDNLEKGTRLVIPPILTVPTPTGVIGAQTQDKITGNTYTIRENDNLWDIAIRAYGDGYKWQEIANFNNVPDPNLIYPGNVLKLPR